MGVIETLLATTILAGVAGTGLGGLIGAMLQKDSKRTVSLLLSFAGGVMLSVVCLDLVPEAFDLAREFGIESIPTLVVLKDGKIAKTAMGARPKDAILALLKD